MNISKIAAELRFGKAYDPVPDSIIRERLRQELGSPLTSASARATLASLRAEVARQQELRAARQENRPLPRAEQYPLRTADRYLAAHTAELADVGLGVRQHYTLGARHDLIWDCLPTLQILSSPESRIVSTKKEAEYTVYRGSYKGWPANMYEHTITVSPALVSGRLRQLGIEIVDGMLTLAARRVPTPNPKGIEGYEAVWLVQRRGCELGANHGYIAVRRRGSDVVAVHGTSLRGAVHTLARRIAGIEGSARRAELARLPAEALYARAADAARRNPAATITLSAARHEGYCDTGIRSYCHRAGIESALEAGRISAADLYAALTRAWDPLAARLLIAVAERCKAASAAA